MENFKELIRLASKYLGDPDKLIQEACGDLVRSAMGCDIKEYAASLERAAERVNWKAPVISMGVSQGSLQKPPPRATSTAIRALEQQGAVGALARRLDAEDDAVFQLWSWLPSAALAADLLGDYDAELCPAVVDIINESSRWISTLQDEIGAERYAELRALHQEKLHNDGYFEEELLERGLDKHGQPIEEEHEEPTARCCAPGCGAWAPPDLQQQGWTQHEVGSHVVWLCSEHP